jgi:hypothetical protein
VVEKEGNRNEESPTTIRGGRKIVVGDRDVERIARGSGRWIKATGGEEHEIEGRT